LFLYYCGSNSDSIGNSNSALENEINITIPDDSNDSKESIEAKIPSSLNSSSSSANIEPNTEEPQTINIPSIPIRLPPPIYTNLFLRGGNTLSSSNVSSNSNSSNYTRFSVYMAELEPSVTLVIINKPNKAEPRTNTTERDEEIKLEKEILNNIQKSLRKSLKNYIDYFITKERAHLSILSYLQQLPGLVHFIFVDRMTNRVIAPTIAPLHGQQQQNVTHEDTSEQMSTIIKKKVWEMCYLAQKHLSSGYCSMLIKDNDFQFSYRLWLEDAEGKDVPIDIQSLPKSESTEKIAFPTTPLSPQFYKDLVRRTPKAVKCFELYSLYLGIAPVHLIAPYERRLIGIAKGMLVARN